MAGILEENRKLVWGWDKGKRKKAGDGFKGVANFLYYVDTFIGDKMQDYAPVRRKWYERD